MTANENESDQMQMDRLYIYCNVYFRLIPFVTQIFWQRIVCGSSNYANTLMRSFMLIQLRLVGIAENAPS